MTESHAYSRLSAVSSSTYPPQAADIPSCSADLAGDDQPMFEAVIGPAGTGKSQRMRQRASQDSSVTLTATTGIAAMNLGAWCTIQSLLHYFDTASLRECYANGRLQRRLRDLSLSGVTRIIIDELSMLSGDQLTLLVRAILEVNRRLPSSRKIGLTLTGDFCQLPPVKEPYAFESAEWHRFADGTTILREIWRQDDQDFIAALGEVRRGQGCSALEFFAPLTHDDRDMDFEGTTIMGRNSEVNAHNQVRLDALHGRRVTFVSEREGKQAPEWKVIPDVLELKEGAVVMVLANRRRSRGEGFLYVNGDLGTLVSKDPSGGAIVHLQRTGEEICVEAVERDFWRWGKKDPERLPDGWIRYMPLRCAYASTVHKTQGLTLDRVQLDLRDYYTGNPGSLYVALSRARTAEGLRIVGSPKQFIHRCSVDPKVRQWL
jgi:ATP-dependent DNA helicase PIF1